MNNRKIPKMKPCPTCGVSDDLGVYSYDNGWNHVECTKCHYLGPGEDSIRAAAKSHNAKVTRQLGDGSGK